MYTLVKTIQHIIKKNNYFLFTLMVVASLWHQVCYSGTNSITSNSTTLPINSDTTFTQPLTNTGTISNNTHMITFEKAVTNSGTMSFSKRGNINNNRKYPLQDDTIIFKEKLTNKNIIQTTTYKISGQNYQIVLIVNFAEIENSGTIDIDRLYMSGNITNSGTITSTSFYVTKPKLTITNQQGAQIKFDAVTTPYSNDRNNTPDHLPSLTIKNYGLLELPGYSTIPTGEYNEYFKDYEIYDYYGYNDSELVLTTSSDSSSPLFDCNHHVNLPRIDKNNAKIILKSKDQKTSEPKNITIIGGHINYLDRNRLSKPYIYTIIPDINNLDSTFVYFFNLQYNPYTITADISHRSFLSLNRDPYLANYIPSKLGGYKLMTSDDLADLLKTPVATVITPKNNHYNSEHAIIHIETSETKNDVVIIGEIKKNPDHPIIDIGVYLGEDYFKDKTLTNYATITNDTAIEIHGPGPYTVINKGVIKGTKKSLYFQWNPSCFSNGSTFNLINYSLISGNIEVEKNPVKRFFYSITTDKDCGMDGYMNKSTITNEDTGVISGDNLDLGAFVTIGGFKDVYFYNKGLISGKNITLIGGNVDNSGTISAKQDFTGFYYNPDTINDKTNKHRLTNKTGGLITVQGNLTLSEHSILENQQGATITVAKQAEFHCSVDNAGFLETTGTSRLQFENQVTNNGIIIAKAGLTSYGAGQGYTFVTGKTSTTTVNNGLDISIGFGNQGYFKITGSSPANFNKYFENNGTITTDNNTPVFFGKKTDKYYGYIYNHGYINAGSVTSYNTVENFKKNYFKLDKGIFHNLLINEGQIYVADTINITTDKYKDNYFNNLSTGSITFTKQAILNARVTNAGTITIKDNVIFEGTFTNTNTGTIRQTINSNYFNLGDPKHHYPLTNSGYIQAGSLTVYDLITNTGYIEAHKAIFDSIINNGQLYTKDILQINKTFTNNKSGSVTFTHPATLAGNVANDGKITINSSVTFKNSLENTGTITQTATSKSFILGSVPGTYTLANYGYIQAGSLTAYNPIDNDINGYIGIHKAVFNASISNFGQIYANDNIQIHDEFYNAEEGSVTFTKEATLSGNVANDGEITIKDNVTFKGPLNNNGIINQTNSTKYFILGDATTLPNTINNDGTITAGNLTAFNLKNDINGYFEASNTAIFDSITNIGRLSAKDDVTFKKNLTNSGTITQTDTKKSFIFGDGPGQYTLTKYTLTNSGYIQAGSLTAYNLVKNVGKTSYLMLNKGTFAVLENYSQLYVTNNLQINNTFTNYIGGSVTFTQQATLAGNVANDGEITIQDDVTFKKNLTNSGTITQTDTKKSFIFGDGSSGQYTLTNSGYIQAGSLTAYDNVENQYGGEIKLTGNSRFNTGLHNLGDIEVSGTNPLTIVGYATNEGNFTVYDLISKGKFDNLEGNLKVKHNAEFCDTLNNSMEMHIANELKARNNITNTAVLKAKQLNIAKQLTITNNYCVHIDDYFNSPNLLDIDNQASFALAASTTIHSYLGNKSSELILTLPSTKTTNALLNVTTYATFTKGAKIIIAATSAAFTYLTNASPTITLISTNKGIHIDDKDTLLFSRVYDKSGSKYTPLGYTPGATLTAGSVLFDISEVTYTAKLLTAKLHQTDATALQSKLTQQSIPLLSCILKGAIINPIAQPFNGYLAQASAANTPLVIPHSIIIYGSETIKAAVKIENASNANYTANDISINSVCDGEHNPKTKSFTPVPAVVICSSATTGNHAFDKNIIIDTSGVLTTSCTSSLSVEATINVDIINKGFVKGCPAVQIGDPHSGSSQGCASSYNPWTFNTPIAGLLVNGSFTNKGTIKSNCKYGEAFHLVAKKTASITEFTIINEGKIIGNLGFYTDSTAPLTYILKNKKLIKCATISYLNNNKQHVTLGKIINYRNAKFIIDKFAELNEVTNYGNLQTKAGITAHGTFTNAPFSVLTVDTGKTKFNQVLTNSGDIKASNGLTAVATVTNSQGGNISVAGGKTEFNTALTNSGIINIQKQGIEVTGTFTNKAGELTVDGGLATFNAEVTNSAKITAKKGLTVAATVTNSQGGNISVAGNPTKFKTALTNSGNITAKQGIEITGTFTNKAGELTVRGALAKFNAEVSNSGTIDAQSGLTVAATVTNSENCNISVAGGDAKFNTALTNSGIIKIKGGIEVTGTFTNKGIVSKDIYGNLIVSGSATFNAEVTNSGIIDAQSGLTVAATVTNSEKCNISVTGITSFNQNLINSGEINANNGIEVTGTFTNKAHGELAVYGALAKFNAEVTNSGKIYAQSGLTVAATVTNSQGGNISVAGGKTEFNTALTNSGMINIQKQGIEVTGIFTNKAGELTVDGGLATFNAEVTNSAKITAKKGLTVAATVTNSENGDITVYDGATKFNAALTNSGNIYAPQGIEVTGTFTNKNKTVMVDGALAKFNAEVSNSGTIDARFGLTVAATATNSQGGNISVSGSITNFNQNLTNSSYITAENGIEVTGTFTNKAGGKLDVYVGLATFNSEVTNSGTIKTRSGLIIKGKFTNTKTPHGQLIINNYQATLDEVINHGAICAYPNTSLTFVKQAINTGSITTYQDISFKENLINQGTITTPSIRIDPNEGFITRLDISKQNFILGNSVNICQATNTGYIKASSLTAYSKIINQQHGNIDIDRGNFHADITNSGTITITNITSVAPNVKFTNNANSELAIINNCVASNLAIDNYGCCSLQGPSTVTSYNGGAKSELIITLPTTKPTSALLDVTTYATFDNGAKIILDVNNYLGYLQSKHSMTILKANTLTIRAATIDDLLYSRIYNHNYQEVTTTNLTASSVLINITNIKRKNNKLIANIQQRTVDFSQSQSKNLLTSSLLGNSIVNPATITGLGSYLYKIHKTTHEELKKAVGTIYADSAIKSAVKIESASPATQQTTGQQYSASFTIDCTVDGAHDKENHKIHPPIPALVIAATPTTSTNPIPVAPSVTIGKHGLLVGAPAIKLASTVVNGSLTNNGIIQADTGAKAIALEGSAGTTAGKFNIINNGTIEGDLDFTSSGNQKTVYTVDNSGLITTTRNSANFQNLINQTTGRIKSYGDITFLHDLTNDGSITQINSNSKFNLGDSSNNTYTTTNTGYIKASNLIAYNKIVNQKSGKIDIIGSGDFHAGITNSGIIDINTGSFEASITNSGKIYIDNGSFDADIINNGTITITNITHVGSNVKFTNNASSIIEITNSFQAHNLAIENQSSVLLPVYSEIASYEGKGTSELVLTLPDNNIKTPLLKVTNDASFSQKSKIILAGKLTALGHSYKVDIIDASTIHGTVTNLLYSQVYNNTPKPTSTTQLASASIFINIATATLKTVKNRDTLTAVVEFINPLSSAASLTTANKTATSLLGYDILKETNILNATRTVSAPKIPKPTVKKPTPKVVSTVQKGTTAIPKHLQHIDTSGVEYSQVVNNHLGISSSLIDSISIIAPANQQSFNLRNLNYNILGALGYYSGSDNHAKFKHSWKQTLLHIGGESALDKTKFGLSFAYLGCDMSVSNKPNSKSNSYLTIVHAITNMSPWSFSTGLIFGTTKYNEPGIENKSIGEVSAVVASRYEVTVNKFKVNLGLTSALTHASMSEHKNNNNSIASNKKLFFCLGASAGAARSYNIQNNINITTEINGGYSYTQGIQNENNIIIPSSGSYKLPQNDIAKHNLKINIKNYCYYKKVYYSLSFNCNCNNNSTLFGGNFAASYKF